ncbi:unnamed protein product [Calypogeia fissa]
MLTLPLQFEQCWKSRTAIYLNEVEITGSGRGCGRHVRIRRANGALVTRIWNQKCCVHDEELSMAVREKPWMPNLSPRVRRSCSSRRCKRWLNQQIRGAARDASPPGLVVAPVSYATTPALETNDIALSPAGIHNEDRFLNALVTCAPLRVPKDKKDPLIRDVGHEEDAGTVSNIRGEETREETKGVNGKKQKWRLQLEGLHDSEEILQKTVDLSSNSDHVRELEKMILLLESVDVDTAKVLAVCPSIVNISLDKLKSVIDHLEFCGLRRKDLGRILSMTPQILELSVKNHLRPAVRFLLKEVGLRKADLRKVIIRCPRLLVASVDSQLRPTMHYLKGLGFSSMESLVSNNATILTFGIQSKLLPKIQFLQTFGVSHDEAVTMVVRFPAIFNYGVEQNLQPKYDYLVNVMGRDVGHLKAFPQYFGYSLDYRIRPRHEFLSRNNIHVSLRNMLRSSDDEFYARFGDRELDESGMERKSAAGTASPVDQGWRKPVIAEVTGSSVDQVWKKSEIAAVTEASNHRSIPVHFGM